MTVRNVQVINLDRQPLRVGSTDIPAASNSGTTATNIDLNVGKNRKDLRTYYDRIRIIGSVADTTNVDSLAGTVATQVSHTRTVTLQAKDHEGHSLTGNHVIDVWLGVSATDPTVVTTAPDSALAINSSTGVILKVVTTDKLLQCVTDATTGSVKIDVINSTGATFYVWAAPASGKASATTVAIA